MSMYLLVDELQELVKAFDESKDPVEREKCTVQMMSIADKFASIPRTTDEKLLLSIHRLGIELWNLVVVKKPGNVEIPSLACARARHVSCHLTFFANAADTSQTTTRKQLAMAMKAGKCWMDCQQYGFADSCFSLSTECWMKLQRLFDGDDAGSRQIRISSEHLNECRQNSLRVYIFRAEIALHQQQYSIAREQMKKAVEIVSHCPDKIQFVVTSCFNMGLDCHEKELYLEAIHWLSDGYALGKKYPENIDNEIQSSTLQLLALCHVERKDPDNLKKADHFADLSLQEKRCIKTYLLKMKIALLMEESDENVREVFKTMHECSEFTLENGFQITNLISNKERVLLSFEYLDLLQLKFPKEEENIQVLLKKFELMLSNKMINEAGDLLEKQMLSNIASVMSLKKDSLKQLHLLLWEQAGFYFKEEDYKNALLWYDFSLKFFQDTSEPDTNLGKLQRNRSSCFIALKMYDEAKEFIQAAQKHDSDSPHTYFLMFKIALLMKEDEKALEALSQLVEIGLEANDSEEIHGFICLAAQLSFEHGNKKISQYALEKIAGQVKDTKQALVALRCLIRLKYTYMADETKREDLSSMLILVSKAYNHLRDATSADQDHFQEIQWFTKMAWNLSVSCDQFYEEMNKLFLICYELSTLLPKEHVNLNQQKTCLLMAAASGIQLSRDIRNDLNKKEKLEEVLRLTTKCKELLKKMAMEVDDTKAGNIQVAQNFLLAYEFEAKAYLGHQNLEKFIDDAMESPRACAKNFQTLASIALSSPSNLQNVAIKSLKAAIKHHLDQQDVDQIQLSKSIHSLISTSLQNGSYSNAESKEESYEYYQDAFKVIAGQKTGEYPEMEIVWLMTKAWNCGIHLYSANQYVGAEKWCAMAMKFLKHLHNLKDTYETHMSQVFTDIISRIQQSRTVAATEE